jgi:hypothetical protein
MSAPASPFPDLHPDRPPPPEYWPNIDHLVTEDDTPVDNIYSERQQRLLTEPLYSSWAGPGPDRPFLALANVGLFQGVNKPPIVPDMMLSLDVRAPENLMLKRHRSYFIWEFGKSPEIGIEIVSNLEGGELSNKKALYAEMGVSYYVVWDPELILKSHRLSVFILQGRHYVPLEKAWFPEVGLGLTTWTGIFEGSRADWLRWCDQTGVLIATGEERAAQERLRAEQEHQRAEQERQRADEAEARAAHLAEQLRKLGGAP